MKRYAIRVWGDYACFTEHASKAEPRSMPIMPPTAAVGILENIYWKPAQVRYHVRSIHILNPIKRMSIVHKFMQSVPSNKIRVPPRTLVQRSYLKDVNYVIEFDLEALDGNVEKQQRILESRLDKGESFKPLKLGINECPAYFERIATDRIPVAQSINKSFGFVPLMHKFSKNKKAKNLPEHRSLILDSFVFCEAEVKNGVFYVPRIVSE